MTHIVRVIINGLELDPAPHLWERDGRVYVPVRQIVQRLGAQVRLETAAACAAFDPRSGRTTIIGGRRPDPDGPLIAPVERVAAAGGAHFLWEPELGALIIQRPEASLAGKRVALDPGHGGPDPGYARAEGPVEKDCNLSVARWLHTLLRLAGARPVLTRTQDRRRSPARARRANGERIAALVVIHHNSHWECLPVWVRDLLLPQRREPAAGPLPAGRNRRRTGRTGPGRPGGGLRRAAPQSGACCLVQAGLSQQSRRGGHGRRPRLRAERRPGSFSRSAPILRKRSLTTFRGPGYNR